MKTLKLRNKLIFKKRRSRGKLNVCQIYHCTSHSVICCLFVFCTSAASYFVTISMDYLVFQINVNSVSRLGTKLLRLINEKKNGSQPGTRKQLEETRAVDELQMRIVELEHENYTLKDKNVVCISK